MPFFLQLLQSMTLGDDPEVLGKRQCPDERHAQVFIFVCAKEVIKFCVEYRESVECRE